MDKSLRLYRDACEAPHALFVLDADFSGAECMCASHVANGTGKNCGSEGSRTVGICIGKDECTRACVYDMPEYL